MLNFHIVTLFPEFFDSPLATGLLGRAVKAGVINFSFHNPREFSHNKHRHVDDKAYGGGVGMVLQPGPVAGALRALANPGKILLMSAAGRQFNQHMASELASFNDITLICGRYEGIDARICEIFPVEEIALCPAVLNGGETSALAIIEAVGRLCHGFMGKDESSDEESFSSGLLEYPQYTRPEIFEDMAVPEVLLSGDHAKIATWRHRQALAKTLLHRPELLDTAPLDAEAAALLSEIPRPSPAANLSFCLCHYPVYLDAREIGVSSLTNLDIHDIGRISRTYGMADFYVLTPLRDQLFLLDNILHHWLTGPGSDKNRDRMRAMQCVRPVASIEEVRRHAIKKHGIEPIFLATSAKWPKYPESAVTPEQVRNLCETNPVIICLGTAKGLALQKMDFCAGQIRPLRFLGENHLSVRSAAAILADRILGDYH